MMMKRSVFWALAGRRAWRLYPPRRRLRLYYIEAPAGQRGGALRIAWAPPVWWVRVRNVAAVAPPMARALRTPARAMARACVAALRRAWAL